MLNLRGLLPCSHSRSSHFFFSLGSHNSGSQVGDWNIVLRGFWIALDKRLDMNFLEDVSHQAPLKRLSISFLVPGLNHKQTPKDFQLFEEDLLHWRLKMGTKTNREKQLGRDFAKRKEQLSQIINILGEIRDEDEIKKDSIKSIVRKQTVQNMIVKMKF